MLKQNVYRILAVAAVCLAFAGGAQAHDGYYEDYGHRHHRHHHHDRHRHGGWGPRYYTSPPAYYPAPVYVPPPQPYIYGPPQVILGVPPIHLPAPHLPHIHWR